MQTVRFMVTGAPGAGKSTFIKSVCHTQPGMPDSGELVINDNLRLELYAANSPPHGTTWKTMIDLVLGVVLLVDGTQPASFVQVHPTIEQLWAIKSLAVIVAVNKQNLPGAHPPATVRQFLPDEHDYKVFPCVATDKQSTENVLLALIYQLLS